jgi:prevent-host-death family protein
MAAICGLLPPQQRDAKNPDDFAFGQIALYNSPMPRKEINFSQAREQFRALVEDVKRSGRPVTILRRGKPQAVLISYDQFQEKFSKKKESPWRLAGTLQVSPHVDIDEAISEVRKSGRDYLRERIRSYIRDLSED